MKRIVVSIYIDPDFYPPTINAVLNLAAACDELVLVTRNNSKDDFPFPANVKLVKTGRYIPVRDSEKSSFVYKIFSFLRYTCSFWKYAASSRTGLVVLYDSFALYAYWLAKPFAGLKHKKRWYHNHDMPNKQLLRKYSIGWLAAKYEHKAMQSVHYFSLPSTDRLAFYPNWQNKPNYFFLPNYPSLKVYTTARAVRQLPAPGAELRILFQGTIGEGHAFEAMIELLKKTVMGYPLRLILKGSVRDAYKSKLDGIAQQHGVSSQLTWVGLGPYEQLPQLTATCHIGIAIHSGKDNVRKTLGTASNKIYEYAACGLPVLLYDNEQFRKYLDRYDWAFFCNGTTEGLKTSIEAILNRYDIASAAARRSFEQELNFEKYFYPAQHQILAGNAPAL
ncbi:MAG TPA: glycosyltransferase [Ferruginibacter sp.]|nr:glycosyltransferase [Ferruginibacter sp.]HMP21255.1 glycosyltransferase [Ferruginibacter sp.]